jgi:FlaA1/EpsC-like NDP-sugar epimerase
MRTDVFRTSCIFLTYGTAAFIVLADLVFLDIGIYRRMWQHPSKDLLAIANTTLSIMLFVLGMFLFGRMVEVLHSVPVIRLFLRIIMLGGPRFTYRLWSSGHRGAGVAQARPSVALVLDGTGENSIIFVDAVAAGSPAQAILLHSRELNLYASAGAFKGIILDAHWALLTSLQ